jgi:hypothetical protein
MAGMEDIMRCRGNLNAIRRPELVPVHVPGAGSAGGEVTDQNVMDIIVSVLHAPAALAWAQNHPYPRSLHKTEQF